MSYIASEILASLSDRERRHFLDMQNAMPRDQADAMWRNIVERHERERRERGGIANVHLV
jgi:hypothetical protein